MAPETELTLDEMLADPIVHLVMRRDGVEEAHVRALVRRVAHRRRRAEPRSFGAWADEDQAAASLTAAAVSEGRRAHRKRRIA